MLFFSLLVLLLAAAGAYFVWRRLSELKEKLSWLQKQSDDQERQIAALTARIFRLEGGAPLTPPLSPPPLRPAVRPPAEPLSETPQPVLPSRADEWEALVGTNWLNRAGALILVIGIALFLGYSLTHLGAAGKVAIGLAVGLSMLAGGLALERQERYRSFAFSLIAGGWAVTYFTGYAMHGIDAARLVSSPVAGAAILLAISAAMIAHALQYRSETATGLAFLFAFTSLNLTVLTPFSVVATGILAASLLFLAAKFVWLRLAVAGLLLTYLTFVLRYDASVFGQEGLLNGQLTLWIYWVLFECFDLLQLRGRGKREGAERSLLLLNAVGFIGASLLHQSNSSSANWAAFFAISSAAYLVTSFLRAKLAPRPAKDDELDWAGYEVAAAASAGLMAAALIERYSGLKMPLALLMEGELIFVTGLYLRNVWIQWLGEAVLFLAFARLSAVNIPTNLRTEIAGISLREWTPLAVLMAAAFTANRALRGGWIYSIGSSILIAAVVEAEFTRFWSTPVWAALSLAALLIGIRWNKRDLRLQGYLGGLATFIRAIAVNLDSPDTARATLPVVMTVGVFYLAQAILSKQEYKGFEIHAKSYMSLTATALFTLLLFDAVQGRLLTVALGFEGASLLVAGFLSRERILRLSGLVLFLLCIAKLFIYDLRELDTLSRILSFVVLGAMMLGASWVYTKYREKIRKLL